MPVVCESEIDGLLDDIDCLNESPAFIHALTGVVARNLQGWPTARFDAAGHQAADQALAERQARAIQAGAAR